MKKLIALCSFATVVSVFGLDTSYACKWGTAPPCDNPEPVLAYQATYEVIDAPGVPTSDTGSFSAEIAVANNETYSDLTGQPLFVFNLPPSFVEFFEEDCFNGSQASAVFYRIYSDGSVHTQVTLPGIAFKNNEGIDVNYILHFDGACIEPNCGLLPLGSGGSQTASLTLSHSEVGTRLKKGSKGCTCAWAGCLDSSTGDNIFPLEMTLTQE